MSNPKEIERGQATRERIRAAMLAHPLAKATTKEVRRWCPDLDLSDRQIQRYTLAIRKGGGNRHQAPANAAADTRQHLEHAEVNGYADKQPDTSSSLLQPERAGDPNGLESIEPVSADRQGRIANRTAWQAALGAGSRSAETINRAVRMKRREADRFEGFRDPEIGYEDRRWEPSEV
jgi:hypothetical protein